MNSTISIKAKLLFLVLFLVLVAAVNGGLGLYGMNNAVQGLNTVYNDRVVPLRDLKEIADAYAVNVVDTNHKVRNGNITPRDGVASVEHAEKLIREKWQAYLATFLVEEEKALVAEIAPLMKQSDAAIARLKQLFAAGDMDAIATFSANDLYPVIDPVSDAFSKLIQVQLDVAKREFHASEAQYNNLKVIVIALMLIGSFATLAISLGLINRSVVRPLTQAGEAVTAIAKGDLSRQLPPAGGDEIGTIIGRLTEMQTSLRQLISGIGNSVTAVNSSANQLAESTSVSARIGEEQSTQASGIAAGVEQLSVSIDVVSEHTREAKSITTASSARLDENGRIIHDAATGIGGIADAVNAAAATINELESLTDQISSIVSVIREIADQTNLLALNAAIEAARAGEQGRGFAVVADEVRKLAERTTSSTQQVANMIGKIQAGAKRAVAEMDSGVSSVEQGVVLARKAGDSVAGIRDSSNQISNAVDSISAAIQEQASATRDIARKVEQIAEGAERNSAAVAQSASMARQLENQAQELGRMAGHFRV